MSVCGLGRPSFLPAEGNPIPVEEQAATPVLEVHAIAFSPSLSDPCDGEWFCQCGWVFGMSRRAAERHMREVEA